MSPQECQRIAMTASADDAPAFARLVRDFPDWQLTYDRAGFWSAERRLSPASLELHCAHSLNELRAKLMRASK
jgi:hypothetical protein